MRASAYTASTAGCRATIEEIRWRPVAASPPDPDPSVEFSVDGVNWHATEEAWAPGLRAPNLPGSPLCARFISIPGDRQQWLRAGHCFLRQALPPLKFGVLCDLSIRPAGLSCEYLSTHSHGLFSNLSTTLADVIRLNQAEVTVRRIGFERGMMQFKDDAAKDVYPVFFGASAPGDVGGPIAAFDAQTDNHKNYRDLPLAALGAHVKRYFWPSQRVLDVAQTLMERAHVNPGNTLAVCFRGTDKSKEVQLASVEDYIRATRPEVAEHLSYDQAYRVAPVHSTVFPNFSFLSNGTMRVWHPKGPEKMEVWAWVVVEKDAPPEVKQAILRNSQYNFIKVIERKFQ